MNKKMATKIISIGLLLATAIFVLVDTLILGTDHNKLSGYFCNIATECLGAFLTIIVIQNIFDMLENKKEKEEENKRVLEYNELISIYLTYYKRAFYSIITPMDKRNFENIEFPLEIKLQNLKDLHKPSLLVTDSIDKSSIEIFYEYEQLLKNSFKTLADNMNFKYNHKLRKVMLDFIILSSISNFNNAIINHKKYNNVLKIAEQMLDSNDIENLYKDYKNNNLQSNIIIPYFMLYDSLNNKQNMIIEYEKEIEELKK